MVVGTGVARKKLARIWKKTFVFLLPGVQTFLSHAYLILQCLFVKLLAFRDMVLMVVEIVRLRRIYGSCDSASDRKSKFEMQILVCSFYSVLKMY